MSQHISVYFVLKYAVILFLLFGDEQIILSGVFISKLSVTRKTKRYANSMRSTSDHEREFALYFADPRYFHIMAEDIRRLLSVFILSDHLWLIVKSNYSAVKRY
jgi:hypothetical protein